MNYQEMDELVQQIDDALATERLDDWQLSYDDFADTLYVDFDETAPYCLSRYLSGGWMVRADTETGQVHGLQIENVLALEVTRFPFLLDLILMTKPVGFTPSKVEQAARTRAAADPDPVIRSFRASLPLLLKPAA
ncbi:MAG: hypothetical protein KF883_11275 [Thermomicrobiales bacterium]|nr:hypothetical protein [Thermomicrobiales bacterium]